MLLTYYADVSALPDQPGRLPLSSYRLAQLASCRSSERRRQGIGAELLLIHALRSLDPSFLLPLSIEKEPCGKPYLRDSKLFFSLSHSRSFAACAVSDTPVGIDLEGERPMHEPVLRRCFSEQEQALIRRADRPDFAFIQLWTQKESYLKATGDGLRALNSIDLLSPPPNASFAHMLLGKMHLSVCVLGQPAGTSLPELVDLVKEGS